MAEAVERTVRLWILTKSDEDLSFISQGWSLRYQCHSTILISLSKESRMARPRW